MRRCFSLCVLLLVTAMSQADETRIELWKKVETALNQQGLPRTAIEHLDEIIASATADQEFDEVIKAIGRKYLIQAQIEGGDVSVSINRLRADLPSLPAPAQPVLKAILANWYWMYYQQNRWRFTQRTQMAAPPSEEFTTWDLNRILAEADRLFTDALERP